MPPLSTPLPIARWLILSATIILLLSLAPCVYTFQTNCNSQQRLQCKRTISSSTSVHIVKMTNSFQQARLAEQLRLSTKQQQSSSEELSTSVAIAAPKNEEDSAVESKESRDIPEELLEFEAKEARENYLLDLEAPMMTYEKYLTMQEKRIRVTIRYSADAGLRPFYLTVANQIKSTHPDILLEKRILPAISSSGGDETIFDVLVDGKLVIGKKKSKMLKVSSRSDGGKSDEGKGEDGAKSEEKKDSNTTPDIAGGRSLFVSMELIEQQLHKARKRRRPSTMYKTKEEILRGAAMDMLEGVVGGEQPSIENTTMGSEGSESNNGYNMPPSAAMTEAVMRLEKLKAMSTRKNSI